MSESAELTGSSAAGPRRDGSARWWLPQEDATWRADDRIGDARP